MSFRTLFANVLSDLEFTQAADDQRAHDQGRKRSREAGECSAEGDVAKDAEWRNRMLQLDEQQPVEQSASVLRKNQFCLSRRAFHVSSAFSSFTPREAFNSTTSPSRASRASHSPASSGVATNSACVLSLRGPST